MAIRKDINIIPDDSWQRVHVSQGDIGRTLQFVLYEGSTSYTIPTGATVKIQGTKPSGFGFSETCTVSGNTVTVDTTETMTDEFGGIPTELQITSGDDVLGTTNFLLIVERNPHPDTTTDGSMDTIIPELTLLVNEVKGYAEEIEGTYHAYGSPWVASTVAEMTDTDKIYVYVGSESGYTNGNWYYYNGTAWVSGGVYNAVAVSTDTTLSVSGMPADAKVVGDEITDLKSAINNIADFDELANEVNVRTNNDLVCMYNQGTYTASPTAPSYVGTKTYSYLGFAIDNKENGVFFAKIKVSNIGSVNAPSVKRHIAYNNSPTAPANALQNGTDTSSAINLPVGANTTIYHRFTPEYTPSQYTAIGVGFLFGTIGVTLQIEGVVIDVTDFANLSDEELKSIVDSSPMEYVALRLPANSLADGALSQVYQWMGKRWSSYGDSISWLYDWHTYVNNLLGFSGFVRNGKPGAPISWTNATFGINANGIYTADDPPADTVHEGMCSYERISKTIDNTIDLIFVMGGTNDFLSNIPIGDLTFDASSVVDSAWHTANAVGDYDISTFKGAMASMLMKLQYYAPNALIVFGTLLNGVGATSGANQYVEQVNTLSLKPSDYAKASKEVCEVFGVPCVDVFSECGISVTNRATYISDTVHPNANGMKLLGRCVASGIGKEFRRV